MARVYAMAGINSKQIPGLFNLLVIMFMLIMETYVMLDDTFSMGVGLILV